MTMTNADTPLTPITATTYPQPPISGYGENNGDVPPVLEAPPAEGPPGKSLCTICGAWVKDSYLHAHKVKQHDVGRTREFKPRPTRPKGKAKSHKGPQHKAVQEAAQRMVTTPPPVMLVPPGVVDEPMTADTVLETLVELRWPEMMPTHKVLEMSQIRTALEKFLA